MRKAFLALALLVSAVPAAHALPQFWETYKAHYGIKGGSDAAKATCQTCHTAPPQLNVFGKTVKNALHESGSMDRLTAQVLDRVASLDSDGDGFANGAEAKGGFLPGDPKSHPTGAAKKVAPDQAAKAEDLVPKHSFHPTLVHFPIALFILGALLDLLGWRRGDAGLRRAASWNLGFGSVSTALAVPTGFVAALRLGYPLTGGPVLIHWLTSAMATLLMAATAVWQLRRTPTSAAYWALLVLSTLAVAAAGHFGGGLVYG